MTFSHDLPSGRVKTHPPFERKGKSVRRINAAGTAPATGPACLLDGLTDEQQSFFHDLPFVQLVARCNSGDLVVRGSEQRLYRLTRAGLLYAA